MVKALPIIGNYITNIFNSSFAQRIFPSSWKQAQIIALKKKVAPLTASDFRPIALLCFLSKDLEKNLESFHSKNIMVVKEMLIKMIILKTSSIHVMKVAYGNISMEIITYILTL